MLIQMHKSMHKVTKNYVMSGQIPGTDWNYSKLKFHKMNGLGYEGEVRLKAH